VVLHHFIVEHGEVQGKSEFDGVARREGDSIGIFVSVEGVLFDLL
jgi:hypothetical protein